MTMTSKFPVRKSTHWLIALGVVITFVAQAQDPSAGLLTPPVALLNENVPPVSVALQADVTRYTEFKPTSFTAWHSKKREMLVVRHARPPSSSPKQGGACLVGISAVFHIIGPGREARQRTHDADAGSKKFPSGVHKRIQCAISRLPVAADGPRRCPKRLRMQVRSPRASAERAE